MTDPKFPPGWDESRIRRTLDHHEKQSDEEAAAEDDAAWEDPGFVFVAVPRELAEEVRSLIAKKTGTGG